MLFDDYVLRQVRQLTEAIARLGQGLSGEPRGELWEQLDDAYHTLFGLPRDLAESVDVQTLARTLGDPRKLPAAIDLMRVHASLCAADGDLPGARFRLERAQDLAAQADDPESIAGPLAAVDRALADLGG